MEQQFIVIKNFEELQHYKDRNPLWIKLYTKILRSDKMFYLNEKERWIYVGLLLLASMKDNKVLYDLNFVKANICHWETTNEELDEVIKKLVEIDMVAIKLLSDCYQNACLEKRREEKNREEKNIQPSSLKSLTQDELKELATKFSVSVSCVNGRIDDLIDYCAASGKKYKDYVAALRNFLKSHIAKHPDCVVVKKDAPKIPEDTRSPEEKAKDRERRDKIMEQSKRIIKKL
jgi:hypothetical protein